MKFFTHQQFLLKITVLVITFFVASCDQNKTIGENQEDHQIPLSSLQLQQATDCDDLKQYVTQSLIERYTSLPDYYQYCASPVAGGGSAGVVSAPATSDSSLASPEKSTPDSVTDTNNQEVGVNEGDIVKTDALGNIYILSGNHFIIAKGFPPQDLTKSSELNLGMRGIELFLDVGNQRVIVIARPENPYYIVNKGITTGGIAAPASESDYSVALFFDVANKQDPVLIKQFQFKGYYREGRHIDDRLHLVSNSYARLDALYQHGEFLALQAELRNVINEASCNQGGASTSELSENPAVKQARVNLGNKITEIIDTLDPSSYLPDAFEEVDGGQVSLPYLACKDIHYPGISNSLGMQILSSVDSNGENLSATAIINNARITYASSNNLYMAENSYSWWWRSDNLEPPKSQTAIYKFSISSGKPRYVATGRVDGNVLNQFSFSEHAGALRVATTQNDTVFSVDENGAPVWDRYLNNHLYVLKDSNEGGLKIVGDVKDFVADETIRSVRFMGDKGFVVTFRNIDPLFSFDLSSPTSPRVVDELTLPGFSTYMHPYNENTLITIGRAGGEGGLGTGRGIQLQLIDVSDLANLKLLHSLIPTTPDAWSWSSAAYDHKAFTFDPNSNVLAVPIMMNSRYSSIGESEYFNGIVAFDVSLENGIIERGRVDHSDLARDYYCLGNPDLLTSFETHCVNGWYVEWAAPRRSVIMTSDAYVYLYSISDIGMKVSEINDVDTVIANALFPPQPYPWWRFGPIGIGISEPAIGGGVAF